MIGDVKVIPQVSLTKSKTLLLLKDMYSSHECDWNDNLMSVKSNIVFNNCKYSYSETNIDIITGVETHVFTASPWC